MADTFDLPIRYVAKVIFRCMKVLERVAHECLPEQGSISTPSAERLAARAKEIGKLMQYGLENYFIAIDGFLIRTTPPPAARRDELKATHRSQHYCARQAFE